MAKKKKLKTKEQLQVVIEALVSIAAPHLRQGHTPSFWGTFEIGDLVDTVVNDTQIARNALEEIGYETT